MSALLNKESVQIECLKAVHPEEWDALAKGLDGGFFHCYAHAVYESSRPNVTPCFVKAFDAKGELIGVALGFIQSPRFWPFSCFSRVASFGGLPLTREKTAESQVAVLAGIEHALRRKGVCRIEMGSYDSPTSGQVLSRLSYHLRERAEFYLDLDRSLDQIWKDLTAECRNTIRKAQKLGIVTQIENSPSSLEHLLTFQHESLQRRGVNAAKPGKEVRAAMLSLLKSHRAELLVSYLDETPINAALFGVFDSRPYYLLSGSSSAGRKNAGPPHLIWTMVARAKSAVAKVLNLGGSAIPRDRQDPVAGLYRFKRDFGAAVIHQPAGTKILSPSGAFLSAILARSKQAFGRV